MGMVWPALQPDWPTPQFFAACLFWTLAWWASGPAALRCFSGLRRLRSSVHRPADRARFEKKVVGLLHSVFCASHALYFLLVFLPQPAVAQYNCRAAAWQTTRVFFPASFVGFALQDLARDWQLAQRRQVWDRELGVHKGAAPPKTRKNCP